MNTVQSMLQTHPTSSQIDINMLASCIQECYDCATVCNICADACLGEDKLQMLVKCIRLNNDCVDACIATGRMLSRLNQPNWPMPAPAGAGIGHCLSRLWRRVQPTCRRA